MVVVITPLVHVVVGVMDLVDDRAAGHEEHALGHCVVEEVEHGAAEDEGRGIRLAVVVEPEGYAEAGEDVCQLAHGGVCQDLLDVVLDEGD